MINQLLETIKSYNPDADTEKIVEAYELAKKQHEGQLRNSGEEYIIHPLNVALILAEMNMDTSTIIAGILHDVIEDTDISYEQIEKQFGTEIADLVDGVTKLKKLSYQTQQEKQAENIRKMVLAMAKDIRVVIVKFADRLHNMRTLEYMNPEKKIEKAMETIEIYAPLADRLGMSKVKWELEDLSLRYLDPDNYNLLVEKVAKRRAEREEIIENIIHDISIELKKAGISAEIQGRPKNFYSIYKKMEFKGKTFDEIYDLSAIRILVDDVKDCYGALGVVHNKYRPIPGRFKDYIAMPKANKYQSLHTTVIDDKGETFEVQIRTFDMHKTAEYGIAAHWKYKEGVNKATSFDENLTWLRQLLDWQSDVKDPNDFMETLKIDFFADEVYVFTPNGDVINLPYGATPIDFAYRVHSGVGNTCVGAKVNGRIVPLDTKLSNGNIVEIITSKNASPSLDWLNIVQSAQAKSKIKQFFKVRDRDQNIIRGQESIERELKKLGHTPSKAMRPEWMDEICTKLQMKSLEDLYAGVGYGSITVNQVVAKLHEKVLKEQEKDNEKDFEEIEEKPLKQEKPISQNGIVVKGLDNAKVRIAKCCNPVPGDPIVGYVTQGRGVSVHRKDCENVQGDSNPRLIEVCWGLQDHDTYSAQIEIVAVEKGDVLTEIANKVRDSKLELNSISAQKTRDHTLIIRCNIQIHDLNELDGLLNRLRRLDSIYSANRLKN